MTTFYKPEMLLPYIENSITLPENLEQYDPYEFPHWHVLKLIHIDRPIDIFKIQHNVNVISKLTKYQCMTYTIEQFIESGVHVITDAYSIA